MFSQKRSLAFLAFLIGVVTARKTTNQLAQYTSKSSKGPLCPAYSSLFSQIQEVQTDAMERVLLDYEGNMRPNAFQCCRDPKTRGVTGFRMHLKEYPTGEKRASSGCVGNCEIGCSQKLDFTYGGWYMDFIFISKKEGDQNKILQIIARNHNTTGAINEFPICDAQADSVNGQKQILSPKGIPIGFEYSYSNQTSTFAEIRLIGNRCPFHEKHLRQKTGDVLSFYLAKSELQLASIDNGIAQDFSNSGDAFLAFPQPYVIKVQDDEHLDSGQFFRKILVVNNLVHHALQYEDKVRYAFNLSTEKLGLQVWSMLDSGKVAVPYIYVDEKSKNSEQYFVLKFTNQRNQWPTSARHDFLKVELSYGNFFSYSQSIEIAFIDFKTISVGTYDDESTCFFQEPPLQDITPTGTETYQERRISERDLKISHRTDGFVQQQVLLMCCRNPEGSIQVVNGRQLFDSDVLPEWMNFNQENVGLACSGVIDWTKNVSKFAFLRTKDHYVDFLLFNSVDRVWKSACDGSITSTTPTDSNLVNVSFFETAVFGSFVGVSSIQQRMEAQNGKLVSKLVSISLVFNRCLETPLTARPRPSIVYVMNDPPQNNNFPLSDLQFILPENLGATLTAQAQPISSTDFISLGYCPPIGCLLGTISKINLPITLVDNNVQVPSWSSTYWQFNMMIFTTLMQRFEVTPGYKFQLARRLSIIIYTVTDIELEIQQCKLTEQSEDSTSITFFVEDTKPITLKPRPVKCPQVTSELLKKLNTKEVTRFLINNPAIDQNFTEIPQQSLIFTNKDARQTFIVKQETILYYSELKGLLQQDDSELFTDQVLNRITMTETIEFKVESCKDLQIFFASQIIDMVVKVSEEEHKTPSAVQAFPKLNDEKGEDLPQVCLNGLSFELKTDQKIRQFLALNGKNIVLSPPPVAFIKMEASLLVKYGDSLLLSEIFLVSAVGIPSDASNKSEPPAPTQNEPPTFAKTVFLPEWNIIRKISITQNYELPAIIDSDSALLILHIGGQKFPGLSIQSLQQLSVTFTNEIGLAPAGLYKATLVISDGKAETSYPLSIRISQVKETNGGEDKDKDNNEGKSNSTSSNNSTESTGGKVSEQTGTSTGGEGTKNHQSMQLTLQQILEYENTDQLSAVSFNPWAKAKRTKHRLNQEQELCMPLKVKTTANGEVSIKFGKPIVLNNTATNFLEQIKNSGSVQLQILSSYKHDNPELLKFDWNLDQKSPYELLFSLYFAQPEYISSNGVQADQIYILLADTTKFLRCISDQTSEQPQGSLRRLQQEDKPFLTSIPPNYSILVDLPPQLGTNTTAADIGQALQNMLNSTYSTQAVVASSLSASQLLQVPMQFIWAGINSVQLISHLPMNEIIFPANCVDFFHFIAMVVSFDIYPPTEKYDFGFTDSQPFSAGLEELGYGSLNFFDALGSISLIFIFIIVRVILQPCAVFLVSVICGKNCTCCRKYFALGGPKIMNIFIRFFLETFLELVISSLIGITLKDSILAEEDEMNGMDIASEYAAYITLTLWIAFTVFVGFMTLYAAKTIVKIRKDQLKDFESKTKKKFYDNIETKKRFAWVFRSKTFIEKDQNTQALKRGKSLQLKELKQKLQLADRSRDKLSVSLDLAKIRRFDDAESKEQRSSKKAKTESLKISLEDSIREESTPKRQPVGIDDLDANLIRDQSVPQRQISQIISESYNFSDQVESEKIGQKDVPETEVQFTETKKPSTDKAGEVKLNKNEKNKKESPEISFPRWYSYVSELFLDLDHKNRISLTVNLYFLLRRIALVTVAFYFLGSPAGQAVTFVQFSIWQLVILFAQPPYETRFMNALEIFNELIVLSIGYHVIVLNVNDLDFRIRSDIGLSMMVIITSMIGINGLNWIYQMILLAIRSVRRCYYTALRAKHKSQLKRFSLVRELKRQQTTRSEVKELHRRQGSQQGLILKEQNKVELSSFFQTRAGSKVVNLDDGFVTQIRDSGALCPRVETESQNESYMIETSVEPHHGMQAAQMKFLLLRVETDGKEGCLFLENTVEPHQASQITLSNKLDRETSRYMRSMSNPTATKRKEFCRTELLTKEKEDSPLETAIRINDYSELSIQNFQQHVDNSQRLQISINDIDFEMSNNESSLEICQGPHMMLPVEKSRKAVLTQGKPSKHFLTLRDHQIKQFAQDAFEDVKSIDDDIL